MFGGAREVERRPENDTMSALSRPVLECHTFLSSQLPPNDPLGCCVTAMAISAWSWPVPEAAPEPHREDLALAQAAASGDPDAASRFVTRALGTVRRVVRSIIADRTEADDALQLALLEVLHAAKSYRGEGSLEGWIRRIASRAVLRHARKTRSSRLRSTSSDLHEARTGQAMNMTVLESLPRPLEHYLGSLPAVQREALLLRHAAGHTIVEIGDITDAPIPTVRSRIKKAQQELRRLIQRDLNLGAVKEAKIS